MLYLANNGETCRDQLCQHPQCWETNVRRVRQAVRKRNGIKEEQSIYEARREDSNIKKEPSFRGDEMLSLPTLKVVDVLGDLTTSYNDDNDDTTQVAAVKRSDARGFVASPSPPRLSRMKCRTALATQVPHPSPVHVQVSSTMSVQKNHRSWNEQTTEQHDNEKPNKIRFHEIYDYNEISDEDWQEMFISTAYLVWCPSKKRREKKRSRASSAVTDYRTRGFKNIVEEVLPLPVEDSKKKRRDLKFPTGGKPYSPCRSPSTRKGHFKPVECICDGDYIMTVTKQDVPESLITTKKILASKTKAKHEDDNAEIDKTCSTKVLVDITSRLTSPIRRKSDKTVQEEKNEVKEKEKQLDIEKTPEQNSKTADADQKLQATECETRRVLPLNSVGIPWGKRSEGLRGHCKNSIPHGVDLGVIMEPVMYIPRSASAHSAKERECSNTALIQEPVTIDRNDKSGLTANVEERNHLTSAYRFSPRYVFAPAPTPMTPRTSDGLRRQLSDLIRSNTSRSKTNVQLLNRPSTHYGDDIGRTEITNVRSVPGRQRSRTMDDDVILEVEETNRNAFQEVGAEFLRMPAGQTNRGLAEEPARIELDPSVDKVNDRESTSSFRAVSPSSRTNIPPDIWAELRGDTGSHFHLRDHERSSSTQMTRAFHSSLGLSVYTYTESSWKPTPTKLPQSFLGLRTSIGPYSQTLLPKMPASLTVVPVPCITRSTSSTTKPRVYHVAESSSIRMPRVPAGSPVPVDSPPRASSPVPDAEVPLQGEKDTSQLSSSEEKSFEVLGAVVSEEIRHGEKDRDEEGPGEIEYLIARDVMSHEDVGERSKANPEELFRAVSSNGDHSTKESALNLNELKESIQQIYVSNGDPEHYEARKSPEAWPDEAESDALTVVIDPARETPEKEHVDRISGESLAQDKDIEIGLEPELAVSIDGVKAEQTTTSSDLDLGDASVSLEVADGKSPDGDKTPDNQDSNQVVEHMDSFEQIQPEISNETLLSNKSSDFKLEPFNVESELLRPIHIESDLLLLTEDSYLSLSFDENMDELDSFDDKILGNSGEIGNSALKVASGNPSSVDELVDGQ